MTGRWVSPAVFGSRERPGFVPTSRSLVIPVGPTVTQSEHIVTLPEEIDVRNAADIAAELTHAISRSSLVIIDMHATAFCDCAGVRAMVLAHRRAADSGAELRVVVTAMPVRRIYGLTGVDHLVDLYPSLAAARGMLPRPSPPKRSS
jgi:anti-anti-sigma factor